MRSTISVALDDDNQPMLKIDYQYSEDPEDKILGKFLDSCFTLQGKARLYIQDDIEPKWLIKPILYRYSMSTLDFVPEDGHDGIVLKDASYLFEE